MRRTATRTLFLCAVFATLCSGCIFVEEDCDAIETECYDVYVGTFCDPWGCWDEYETHCEDYCVNYESGIVETGCTRDAHCGSGYYCEGGVCVGSSPECSTDSQCGGDDICSRGCVAPASCGDPLYGDAESEATPGLLARRLAPARHPG